MGCKGERDRQNVEIAKGRGNKRKEMEGAGVGAEEGQRKGSDGRRSEKNTIWETEERERKFGREVG